MPENKKKYTGAWCPSITPFDADGKLDLAALEKHFSRLSEAGTDGVLLMGSIGEFTALSMDERVSLIHAARTMTHLPLIANVSGTCMEDMTRLADAAYSEGYEAVMALPHYYFAQTPRQLEAYFDTLGGRFEGEWLIYNFPARTGCDVDAALIAKLAARFPRFMGVKDTVDCASHTRAIVRAAAEVREDFSVLCGFDEYFIPNLNHWLTESSLYPFIGGDSIDRPEEFSWKRPSINMILPYVNPTFLPGSDDKTRIRLSKAVLENARDILAALERRHLETFTTALTLERLAEALYRPRLPDRGRHLRYDLSVPASSYVADDLNQLQRISMTEVIHGL